MFRQIRNILDSNYNIINSLTPILQYQNNWKFLHNINYTSKNNIYGTKTFEGYLNCGAVCYLTSYLLQKHGIDNKMVKTMVTKNFRDFDHVFIVSGDYIIDPTYRQLFRNDLVCSSDQFMNKLYNKYPYYFLGNISNLEYLLSEYEYSFRRQYESKAFDIMRHYKTYIDISEKQDLSTVVRDIDYAESKGECFLRLHTILNNRY